MTRSIPSPQTPGDHEPGAASPHEPRAAERRRLLDLTASLVEQHIQRADDLPVTPSVTPEEIRAELARYDLEEPTEAADALEHVAGLLTDWTVHTTSPRYFGLFNPTPSFTGILGDTLTAAFNPQLAVWSHAPAAVEIEQHVIRFLGRRLGYPPDRIAGTFTTGGAEANLTAVLVSLTGAFPAYADEGAAALEGRPVFYASEESHLAWLKIAHATGLGRAAVRLVPVAADQRMDVDALDRMIDEDRADGFLPFMVAATAGTTSGGVIDPLPATASLCRAEGLWFHVDAAWAGAAAVSDELRGHLDGIEAADSVTVDAHKWMSAPMGAGMFLTVRPDTLGETFRVQTAYMPASTDSAVDPYATSVQWSRRLTGLKVFLPLAVGGRQGLAAQIERDVALGDELRALLTARGWCIENEAARLPVVCVSHESWRWSDLEARAHAADDVVARANATGKVWVSATRVAGRPAVRACITSYRTTSADLAVLVEVLEAARAAASP